MSTRRNVNLNKELSNDWVGRVRKWEKRWVVCEDKSGPQQPYGARRPLQLLKWVQTDVRTKPEASSRHPDIVPVTDLSLVPGARLGTPMDAAAAAGQVADPLAAPPIQLTPTETTPPAAAAPTPSAAAPDATQQQQQQQQFAPLTVPPAGSGLPPVPPSVAAAAAAVAATTSSSIMVGYGTVSSLTGATAAAGASESGGLAYALPSPSVVTGGVSFDFGAAPSVSYQQGMHEFTPTAAVTASDYTAGTDSEALGRLPHGGVTVSDYTGGTDSMDVDQTNRTGDLDDEAYQDDEVENEEDEQGLGDEGDEEEQGFGGDDEDEDDDDMPS